MRGLLFVCSLLLAGCSATVTTLAADKTPGTEKGEDWPAFLGPRGDSTSTEKGILNPWPKQGLRVVWQQRTGEGYAGVSVSKDRVYFFDRIGDKARLRCLKARTGEFVWKFEYPTEYADKYNYSGGPRCFPIIDDDRVYIYGPEGMLHCVNADNGKEIWKVDTVTKYGVIQNFFGVGSTPVIEGNLLLVQVGGSPKGSDEVEFDKLKSNGTALVALDKKTGEEKWKTGDDLASYSVPVLATIEKRRYCFLWARSGLLALDPSNGKVDWHHAYRAKSLESVNASNPVVVGNQVLLSECYGPGGLLLKVKPSAPEVIWKDADKGRDKSLQCHWMTPIHVDGYVYGSSGRHEDEAELRCVELATGKVMWSERDLKRSSLLLVDGHFICLGEHGTIRLIKVNPKKYEEISSMDIPHPDDAELKLLRYPCWAAPVLSHGLLYVRGKDRLVCLELIKEK